MFFYSLLNVGSCKRIGCQVIAVQKNNPGNRHTHTHKQTTLPSLCAHAQRGKQLVEQFFYDWMETGYNSVTFLSAILLFLSQ